MLVLCGGEIMGALSGYAVLYLHKFINQGVYSCVFFWPLALLATGIAAHADTFTLTGANLNISFSLPASPQAQYSTDPAIDA